MSYTQMNGALGKVIATVTLIGALALPLAAPTQAAEGRNVAFAAGVAAGMFGGALLAPRPVYLPMAIPLVASAITPRHALFPLSTQAPLQSLLPFCDAATKITAFVAICLATLLLITVEVRCGVQPPSPAAEDFLFD
jgi:hypothetical protein